MTLYQASERNRTPRPTIKVNHAYEVMLRINDAKMRENSHVTMRLKRENVC